MRTLILISSFCSFSVFAAERPASPRGQAAIQVLGKASDNGWKGGSWIEVDYGRPILRGRTNIFGAGATYGKAVEGPVWRLGANETTRLKTQIPITLGGKKIAAGEYDLFAELKESGWTLIVSTQPATLAGEPESKGKMWGAYGYDGKFDVARVPMTMAKHDASIEELTISFVDVTAKAATLRVQWEHAQASVAVGFGE